MGEPPKTGARSGVRFSRAAGVMIWLALALLVITVVSIRAERAPDYGRVDGR